MKVDDLYISEYVIYEVGQCVGSLGSHHSNAADNRSVHCSLNETKDVFNQTSCLGFSAVVLLLLVGQRVVAMPFLTMIGFIPHSLTTSSFDS